MEKLTLYGMPLSPFVRKARLVMAAKDIAYDLQPVMPFGDDQPEIFKQNSPLGKIPLLRIGDDKFLPDSSVIFHYLQNIVPTPSLLPEDDYLAARACWFEEYADSHMISIIGGKLWAEVVLATAFFKRAPIQADIDAAINHHIPAIFDYLDSQLCGDYLVGDQLSIADLAVCGVFVSMLHCNHFCDESRWPKVSEYIKRMHASELFAPIIAQEAQMLSN